jgi:hypothetical protein
MKRIVFFALFITFSCFVKAQSDSFRSGVILGYSPNESILETSPLNAGLMAEFILPIVGVGAEVDFVYENKAFQTQTGSLSERFSNFKLPIYAKWRLGVPMFKGILGAGATYSLSWKDLNEYGISRKSFDTWSFSAIAGVEIFNKLQLRINYDYHFLNSQLKHIFKGNTTLTLGIGYWF